MIVSRKRALKYVREKKLPITASLAFINGTIIITALTWTAYLVGVVYHQSFLSELGISAELYPQEATGYFIYAFYACFSTLSAILPPMLSDIIVALVIVFVWVFVTAIGLIAVALEKHRWVISIRSRFMERPLLKKVSFTIFVPLLGSILTFYVPLFFALILTMPVILGQTAAKREAKSYLEKISKGCESLSRKNFPSCTEVTEGGRRVSIGILVSASEKYVGMLEKTGSRSILLDGKELSTQREERSP